MAMVLTRLCWAGRAVLIVLGWLLSYASSVVLILFLLGWLYWLCLAACVVMGWLCWTSGDVLGWLSVSVTRS